MTPWLEHTGHDAIPSGSIGLNSGQRRQAKVSAGDSVSVTRFCYCKFCFFFCFCLFLATFFLFLGFHVDLDILIYCFKFRFEPPEHFNLALLTLELEFVKKGKEEHVWFYILQFCSFYVFWILYYLWWFNSIVRSDYLALCLFRLPCLCFSLLELCIFSTC